MSKVIKQIALTGGTGFLGFHLIHELVARGFQVRVIRRPGSFHPLMPELPMGASFFDADTKNLQSLVKACAGMDAVIHAAGLVSYNKKDQPLMYDTHVTLTKNMIEAAKLSKVKRFVHVSSIVTLGHSPSLLNESAVYNAASLKLAYWDTKTEAERIALQANAADFEVVSVNPGSLLGEGEKSAQLLPFIKKLASTAMAILPDGGSDFLDVRDGAIGTILALEKGKSGERYVLGSENLTYKQIHQRLRAIQNKKSFVILLPKPILSALTWFLDKLEKLTGLDLPINAARLRRVNGVYMFHDLSKAKREIGYDPKTIDQALLAMLKEKSI